MEELKAAFDPLASRMDGYVRFQGAENDGMQNERPFMQGDCANGALRSAAWYGCREAHKYRVLPEEEF